MANPFYNPSGNPATGSEGLSALVRAEFAAISVAFDAMPRISTTGVFDTVFNQQGSYTFTLPPAPGTLAMLADVTAEATARTAAIAVETARATAAEALRAPLASPAFTGTPTVPTPGDTDHTLKAVNSTWVANFLAASGYAPTGASPVTSVATRTGAVTLTHADLTDWAATLAPYALASTVPPLLRGFLGDLTLSIDAVSPLLVLDIAAGTCTDSTFTTTITLAAITKSIGGAWTAGSGNNGMGVGLTATASTWYHVFAVIVAGVADVYFDTSATAANKPASTTAFRRIGSFKLDAAVHIVPFDQYSDRFDLRTPFLEFQGVAGVTTAVSLTMTGAPPGVPVEALLTGSVNDPTAPQSGLYLSSLAQADVSPLSTTAITALSGPTTSGFTTYAARVMTNTTQQIRKRVTSATLTMTVLNNGWIDRRGRN